MSNWKKNKADAVYISTTPTKTDQSQAEQTDINVIVTQFLRTGQTPMPREGQYGDFSQLPEDLRGFIELGRSKQQLIENLPPELRTMPLEDLLEMTNEQITAKLQPPATPPANPEKTT